MMEAARSSEISLSTYCSTQCQNPESKHLATPCCDNLANYTDLTLVTMLLTTVLVFFLNNQQDALIIQMYSVIKLYMFRASSLPIIRSSLLYIRHW